MCPAWVPRRSGATLTILSLALTAQSSVQALRDPVAGRPCASTQRGFCGESPIAAWIEARTSSWIDSARCGVSCGYTRDRVNERSPQPYTFPRGS
jgi:hypothetical protein